MTVYGERRETGRLKLYFWLFLFVVFVIHRKT